MAGKNQKRNQKASHLVRLLALTSIILISTQAHAQKLSYRFSGKPLSDVLEKVGKDNRVKIAFDAQLADRQSVAGYFRGSSINELLSQIVSSTPYEITRIGNVFVLRPKAATVEQPVLPLAASPIETPKYRIWGTVSDLASGEHLPYAQIYTDNGKFSTTANADGSFNLTLPTAETVNLCISYLGFVKQCIEVTPRTRPEQLTVTLDRASIKLGAITVTEKQNYLVQIPTVAGQSTLNPKAAADVPTVNPLDFTAPLQMLPGIDATTESAVGLNIRKSPFDQTQVLFDGFTIYHLNHFLGQLSAFNTNAIKDIQIFKGGFDARYGGAASSIIEITGKSGNRYKPTFSVGADLLALDAMANTPLGKKWSLVFTARRSYTDAYQTKLYDDLFDKLRSDLATTSLNNIASFNEKYTPSYYYYDLHSKITYTPDSTQNLSLSIYSGSDQMSLLSSKPKVYLNETSDIQNSGIGIKWSKDLNGKSYMRASIGYSQYHLNFDHLNTGKAPKTDAEIARRQNRLTNELKDVTAKFEYERRLTPSTALIAGAALTGLQSNYKFINYRKILANTEIDTSRLKSTKGGIATTYFLLNISKGRLKNLTPGFRLSYFTPTGKPYFEPRISATYEIVPNIYAKAAVGRYLQFINRVPITYLGEYNSYWSISDKSHPIVSSNHYIAGCTFDITPNLQVDIEGYLKNTTGMAYIALFPTVSKDKVRYQEKMINGSNKINGIDLFVKYLFPQGQVTMGYTLSEVYFHTDNLKVDSDFPSGLDQTHEFKLFASRKISRFTLSSAWIFGSGKPWDKPTFYNNLKPVAEYQRNSERLPTYHRLDISASYVQPIGKTKLSVTGSIFNVYNRTNQTKRTYTLSNTPLQDVSQGKSPIVYSDIYGFGITPAVYVNLTF